MIRELKRGSDFMIAKKVIMDMLPTMWPLLTFVCVVAISLRIVYLKGKKCRHIFDVYIFLTTSI